MNLYWNEKAKLGRYRSILEVSDEEGQDNRDLISFERILAVFSSVFLSEKAMNLSLFTVPISVSFRPVNGKNFNFLP